MVSRRHASDATPQVPLLFVISFTTLRPEARPGGAGCCYGLRVADCLDPWTLPSWGSRTHHLPLFAWNKKHRDDDIERTYVYRHGLVVQPTFHPARIASPIVKSYGDVCMGSEFVGSFQVAEIMYGSDCSYAIFHPPFRGGGCFLVVVTHVHGGRNVPPGAETVSKLYRAE